LASALGRKRVRSSWGFDAIATLPGIFAAVNKPDAPPDEFVRSEVYIIIPKDKPPFLIIFEYKNKPSYLKFHGNIESLFKALDFKLIN
jgi:hypothetical protein